MIAYRYAARIVRVVDGDTVDLSVDLGFRVYTAIRTRLLGINAPELSTPEGKAARDWLRLRLPVGDSVTVATSKAPGDKYGRWLARIDAPGLGDVATVLMATGHAVPYGGG